MTTTPRASGFGIQPPAGDFTDRVWQGVFSAAGARHAAAAGSHLLLNRAATPSTATPDEIVRGLKAERVLPVATDLIAQFNPGIPDRDAAIRALELIATEVAPALGWQPRHATLAGV
jgi:hypothetical protein